MASRPLSAWWVVPPVVGLLFLIHTRTTLVLDGVLLVVVGTVVASDFRGAADSLPLPMRWTRVSLDTSRAKARRTYALVAAWGLVTIVYALAKPS